MGQYGRVIISGTDSGSWKTAGGGPGADMIVLAAGMVFYVVKPWLSGLKKLVINSGLI
jgi:hypothetical protein